jgi:hypothetical protein
MARPDWLTTANEALERAPDEPWQAPPDPPSGTPPPLRVVPPRVNPYEGFAESPAGRSFSTNWMEEGFGRPTERHPAPGQPAPEDAGPGATHATAPEDATAAHDLAGPETPTAATDRARWSPPPVVAKPWWEPLIARAKSPAGLIVLGIAAVVAIVAMVLMRPKDPSVALSKIRHNVAQYDGQSVTVRGKVGEVYAVGGGYSFYLLQGRDTIVVFTRSRTPVTDQHVSVSGVISTGVLNGAARQALLEDSH